MFVPFNTLDDNSRIWIYQSNRPLTDVELRTVSDALTVFCNDWKAHGESLKTSFTIADNQFIVLAADEDFHLPSGCSIDSSVRVLKEVQTSIGTDFFDRTRIAFFKSNAVVSFPMAELKQRFSSGELLGSTLTFNTLALSKGEFLGRWKIATETTWLAKYLPKSALAS